MEKPKINMGTETKTEEKNQRHYWNFGFTLERNAQNAAMIEKYQKMLDWLAYAFDINTTSKGGQSELARKILQDTFENTEVENPNTKMENPNTE